MRETLQKVSGALMVPIVILPIAAIYLALGRQLLGAGIIAPGAPLDAAGTAILIRSLPLLFAVGVAIGFTRQDGMAAFSAVVGYAVMTSVMTSINKGIDMGVLGGIIAGAFTAALFNRYRGIKFPEWLGLFSGKRFVPAAASLAGLVLGTIFGYLWPPVQMAIESAGRWVYAAGPLGILVYGILNRLLIPTGLHHILNNLIFYVMGSFTHPGTGQVVRGEVPRFFAGDPSAGLFLGGFFLIMVFGLPGACLAITHESRRENRRKVRGMMGTAMATSIVTAITEPSEFAFIFGSPILFVAHGLLTGLALFTTASFGIRHQGEALPMFFINLGFSTRAWLIMPLGVVFFGIYNGVFRFLIRRFNIPTLGREGILGDDGRASDTAGGISAATQGPGTKGVGDLAERLLAALGGAANLLSVESCLTRLRLSLRDPSLADERALGALGASGVSRPGPGLLQVILGTQSEAIRDRMRGVVRGESPASTVGDSGESRALAPPSTSSVGRTPAESQTLPAPLVLMAPMTGRLVPLSEVPDPVFAGGMAGDGVAIDPTEGQLLAPCRARVATIAEGGHGYGLVTDSGLEILLHIGIDTVELKGRGFSVLVSPGDRVEAGQLLGRFDLELIRGAGKSAVSPVLIANRERAKNLEASGSGMVTAGVDPILKLQPR